MIGTNISLVVWQSRVMSPLHVVRREPTGTPKTTPLLFVHGAWHASWCWDEHFLDDFAARGYSVAALDLRGHGQSPARGRLKTTRIADYVDDVAEVAATFDTPPVVIGHSMGGLVVQKYLEKHAAPGGVLVASVPPRGVIGVTVDIARHRFGAFARANATWSLLPLVEDPQVARTMFYSDHLDESTALAHATRVEDEAYFAFLDMLALNRPKPKRVTAPMLVLGGELDTIFPPRDTAATGRAYGTAPVMFDGAHNLMLEPVWPEVAQAISDWLDRRPA